MDIKKKKERKEVDHNYHEKKIEKTTTMTITPYLTYSIDRKGKNKKIVIDNQVRILCKIEEILLSKNLLF